MGKKLSISEPTVLNTELSPLLDNFWLDTDGSTEQWYYENSKLYKPDRVITPLVITPRISAIDKDTSTAYTPLFFTVSWYVNGTLIISTSSSDAYYISGNNLVVRKNNNNVSYPITISCEAQYIDPRDNSIVYPVRSTLELTTNRDATPYYPQIDILTQSTIVYNPLTDEDSNISLEATVDWTNVPVENEVPFSSRYDTKGTEWLLPSNTYGTTCAMPILDILYGTREDAHTISGAFSFRKTYNVDVQGVNRTAITKIQGNTIYLNQLAAPFFDNEGNLSSNWGLPITEEWASATKVGDGIRVEAIDSGADEILLTTNNLSVRNGDIYYMRFRYTKYGSTGISAFCGDEEIWEDMRYNSGIMETVYLCEEPDPLPVFKVGYSSSPYEGEWFEINELTIFDLTDIFGNNVPSDFELWLNNNIGCTRSFPYGKKIYNVKLASLLSNGLNQWDEKWELKSGGIIGSKNPIRVIPNTNYYFFIDNDDYEGNVTITQYDGNLKEIATTNLTPNNTFRPTDNTCYIGFILNESYGTEYLEDICINISGEDNGSYEPYELHTTTVDITNLTGKLDGSNVSQKVFPYGMKSIGSTKDEIKYDNDVLKSYNLITDIIGSGELQPRISANSALATFRLIDKIDMSNLAYFSPTYDYGTISHVRLTNMTFCFYEENNEQYCLVHDETFKGLSYTELRRLILNGGVQILYVRLTPQVFKLDPVHVGVFEWLIYKDSGIGIPYFMPIEQDPCYISGQHTSYLEIDAKYSEDIRLALTLKKHIEDANPMPMRVTRNIIWKIPPVESTVVCKQGNGVRNKSSEYTFSTIYTTKDGTIDASIAKKHFRNKWFLRNATPRFEGDPQTTDSVQELGFGVEITINSSLLFATYSDSSKNIYRGSSKLVYNEVYMLGAYQKITYNNDVVTYNNEIVYGRSID